MRPGPTRETRPRPGNGTPADAGRGCTAARECTAVTLYALQPARSIAADVCRCVLSRRRATEACPGAMAACACAASGLQQRRAAAFAARVFAGRAPGPGLGAREPGALPGLQASSSFG